MDQQDEGRIFKSERRTELDGGLDTRAGVFTNPDRALALQNFRFSERGSITKRKGGSKLCDVNAFNIASILPAPTLVASAAGGTLAAGNYTVAYTLGTVLGTKIGISGQTTVAVVGPTGSISIRIPPLNSGLGAGTTAAGADDPFNGGYLDVSANHEVYVKKDADPSLTKQTVAAISWDGALLVRSTTLTAYTTTGGVAPSTNQVIPMRSIFWHPGLEATLGWVGEFPVHFSGAHTTPTYLARAFDGGTSGPGGVGTVSFSRFPSRIFGAIIDNVAIAGDGIGRPRKLDTPTPSNPATWRWVPVGVEPPAAPTAALGAAVGLTGAYIYKMTLVSVITKPDGTTYQAESDGSIASNTISPANQKVTVTLPTTGRTDITLKNVYRTVAGGANFLFLLQTAAATASITDSAADNTLLAISPSPDNGKISNGVPPDGLYFVTEHAQRLWGVVINRVLDGSSRILRLRATNEIAYSKSGALGTAASVDAWPAVFHVKCGAFSSITQLVSFRGLLYIFKEDEIGVIEGDDDLEFRYRTIWKNSGAMEGSVVEADESLWCFDESRTVLRVSGYAVQDVGLETIQTGWQVSPAVETGSENATGGGRGTILVREAIWDPVESEVRWVMTDFHPSPTLNNQTGYAARFYEYVMAKDPSGALSFTIFTGAASGAVEDRRIMGNCRSLGFGTTSFYRGRDCLYADYHGRLVRDNQVEADLDNTTAITLSAVWPMFFGDNPEMEKLFRYIYALILTGATGTDSFTFSAKSLSKQSGGGLPKVILTFAGGVTENQMLRMDPIAPFDTVNVSDRGLLLQFNGTAKSGPMRIRELCSKYQDVSDERISG